MFLVQLQLSACWQGEQSNRSIFLSILGLSDSERYTDNDQIAIDEMDWSNGFEADYSVVPTIVLTDGRVTYSNGTFQVMNNVGDNCTFNTVSVYYKLQRDGVFITDWTLVKDVDYLDEAIANDFIEGKPVKILGDMQVRPYNAKTNDVMFIFLQMSHDGNPVNADGTFPSNDELDNLGNSDVAVIEALTLKVTLTGVGGGQQ